MRSAPLFINKAMFGLRNWKKIWNWSSLILNKVFSSSQKFELKWVSNFAWKWKLLKYAYLKSDPRPPRIWNFGLEMNIWRNKSTEGHLTSYQGKSLRSTRSTTTVTTMVITVAKYAGRSRKTRWSQTPSLKRRPSPDAQCRSAYAVAGKETPEHSIAPEAPEHST